MKSSRQYMHILSRTDSKNTGAHFTVSFRKIFRKGHMKNKSHFTGVLEDIDHTKYNGKRVVIL